MQIPPFDEPDFLEPFKLALDRFISGRHAPGDKSLLVDFIRSDEEAKKLYLNAKRAAGKEDLRLPGEGNDATWGGNKPTKHVFKPELSNLQKKVIRDRKKYEISARLIRERERAERRLKRKHKRPSWMKKSSKSSKSRKTSSKRKPSEENLEDDAVFPWHWVLPVGSLLVMLGLGAAVSVVFIGVGSGTGSIEIPETLIHLDTDLIEPDPIFVGDIREEVGFRVPQQWLEGSVFARAVDQLLQATTQLEEELEETAVVAVEQVEKEDDTFLTLEALMKDLKAPWDTIVEFEDYIEILPENG